MESVGAAGTPLRSWSDVIGRVYTDAQVEQLLGVNSLELAARVESKALLSLHTEDGKVVYPTFQFAEGDVVHGLPEVLELTVGRVDEWTLASWLVAQQPSLGQSVIDHLRACGAAEEVISLTRRAVEGWLR